MHVYNANKGEAIYSYTVKNTYINKQYIITYLTCGATVKWAARKELLMALFELMATTSTSYSALGTRSRSLTLVVPEVFTVV